MAANDLGIGSTHSDRMILAWRTVYMLMEMHRLDPTILPKLINRRVPCSASLVDHPSIQIGKRCAGRPDENCISLEDGSCIGTDCMHDPSFAEQPYEVGFLGILNGLFGTDEKEWGVIEAVYEDDRHTFRELRLRDAEGREAATHV